MRKLGFFGGKRTTPLEKNKESSTSLEQLRSGARIGHLATIGAPALLVGSLLAALLFPPLFTGLFVGSLVSWLAGTFLLGRHQLVLGSDSQAARDFELAAWFGGFLGIILGGVFGLTTTASLIALTVAGAAPGVTGVLVASRSSKEECLECSPE